MATTRIMRSLAALTFVGLLSTALPRQAAAAPILDQSCCVGTNLSATLITLTRAQTFTVGITGTMTSADVLLSLFDATGSVQFDIVPGFGAGATVAGLGAPLASYNFSWSAAAGAPSYVNLDFADLAVSAGDVLAIVMRPIAVSLNATWVGATGNPYAGGEALTTSFPAPNTFTVDIFGSSDFGFRTYVEATAPEPATLALFASAMGAVMIRRHRRRNTSRR